MGELQLKEDKEKSNKRLQVQVLQYEHDLQSFVSVCKSKGRPLQQLGNQQAL